MSVSYWGIVGYGVCLEDIEKYLNKGKVIKYLKILDPEFEAKDDPFSDDTFYGSPYDTLGDFLCHIDNKKIMNYTDNGYDRHYFLYEPPYPWHRKANEPSSVTELKRYITDIINEIYDIPEKALNRYLDYIDTAGIA